MRAFRVTGPGATEVVDLPRPEPGLGEVVVDVARVGVCGTDVEFFTGEMAYLHQGHARYPVQLGHEWCGTVSELGAGVDGSWLGRRTTGDTMLGCGHCPRCRSGRHHVCAARFEIGIRGGFPGALAEAIAVPVTALHPLPDAVDDAAGAMVEPGGNALRCVQAARCAPGDPMLVLGPGAIGLLVALLARAQGVDVHLLGRSARSLDFARRLGFTNTWKEDDLPDVPFRAVVDATNAATMPALALDRVEPAGRLVFIGLAGTATPIDTRDLLLADITAVGILSASPGLAGAIAAYESGAVDPRPLVAATVGLDDAGLVLDGWRPEHAGDGPKIQVDPRR